jgi:streptogramin lyase
LALAADGRGVWAISHDERVVTRLDARSGARRSRTTLAWDPHGLALGEGGVWVADLHAGAVHGLDPATAAPSGRRVRLDLAPERLAAGLGGVWVLPASTGSAAREGDDRLVRIDPRRRRPVGTLRLGGGSPQAVAVGAGRVWAATAAPDRLLLLRPAAPARP